MNAPPTLALEDIELRFGERKVLDGLSLTADPAEVLVLLGPSGCGKTSVLRILLGLLAPTRGTVRLQGEPVSRAERLLLAPEERHLAMVFQDLALWPHLTVHGNLAFGLEARGVPRAEREEHINVMLRRVGLISRQRSYPGELSGGERQRVAIARALVLEPRAVLLDEPLSNLDPSLRRELLALFRELFRERRSSAIYVTHEPREAAHIGDRLAVLEQGRIVQVGTVAELRGNPASAFVRSLFADLDDGERLTSEG